MMRHKLGTGRPVNASFQRQIDSLFLSEETPRALDHKGADATLAHFANVRQQVWGASDEVAEAARDARRLQGQQSTVENTQCNGVIWNRTRKPAS